MADQEDRIARMIEKARSAKEAADAAAAADEERARKGRERTAAARRDWKDRVKPLLEAVSTELTRKLQEVGIAVQASHSPVSNDSTTITATFPSKGAQSTVRIRFYRSDDGIEGATLSEGRDPPTIVFTGNLDSVTYGEVEKAILDVIEPRLV